MTQRRVTHVLTVVLISGALAAVAFRSSGRRLADLAPNVTRKNDPSPQDALYEMLDAAREGNVTVYLNAYTGALEASLRQSAAEQGAAAFARHLRETNGPIKGIAITEPEKLNDREVRARVESVYSDRNETQTFYLEKQADGRWKITRLDTAERIRTSVPYGTPVK
jgi:hypothetical protein